MLGKIEMRPPPGGRPRDGRHCDLCGCSQPAVRCDKCGCQIFCLSCDDMYHRHPKRRFHLRKAVDPIPAVPQARPVLPMKVSHLHTINPGDPSKMPLPPPRKKKSLFGSFRRPSPSSDNSPPLPRKEHSWSNRLGSIKKFMSNRPLPPLPTGEDNDTEQQPTTNGQPPPRGDLSFIHKRSEDRPPQLPQRSPKTPEFPGIPERDARVPNIGGQMPGQLRNGGLEPNAIHMNQNREFHSNEENQWNNRMHNQNGHQQFPPQATLSRQNQRGFMPPGMHGYPGTMHQSSSSTDLRNINNVEGLPNTALPPPHYPHYPMNLHMPPHYPYPMYPQFPNYPQYFGNSFANLSNPPTTDGDFSDQSETSIRPSSKKYPFRKRAKRSQSVVVDKMQYPGQFYPFGPFPGYGPWGAPMPMEAPPSPASSIRSLNRTGRSRRRKKTTSDDDDEEISASSSPLSRPKSSSSDRPPKDPQRAPLATQTTSSEDESEEETNNRRNKLNTIQRRFSDPKRASTSPATDSKKSPKLKKRSSSRQSDRETPDVPPALNERRPSKDSNADQPSQPQPSPSHVSPDSWECKHCTFINPIANRICQVCCKTATPPTETPVTANSRSSSASGSSRKPSVDLEKDSPSPVKIRDNEEDSDKKDKRDMAILNSALDEAEKEISRGLEELMKLKEDMDNNISKEKPAEPVNKAKTTEEQAKPVYKSTGKMRTSILDKLSINKNKPSTASTSTTTDTQTGQSNWTTDKIIEARRHSNSSTTSETYNSPLAQSPELENKFFNKEKRDSSCQTQQDNLIEYLERKKAAEEAFLGRPINNFGFGYGDRMDMMTSPVPPMYDRYLGGGGFGMMQRSHSRASLFTGRLNEPGPFDFGGPGFGYAGAPMYRSISRGSLTGDYPEGRLSEFHNLRKPDFYLSMEELVERRRQETVRAQGLELVRMIREAEQQGFTAEDIQVALTHCGKQSPMEWLQENWRNMVDSVVTLSTNYGNDKKENDIGLLSESEARDALRLHKGNIWAAVTECVESRQRKYLELSARGKFSRKDIVEALNSSEGDVEMAYAKLSKSTGKPFLMRIWGAGEGAQNQDGALPMPDDVKNATLRYQKDETVNSDYLSDDLWSEDGAVEWDEEEDYDDEKGDLEDLQTCHEDFHGSPQDMKTPESDKSDYCDAFPVEDRNVSSPSDDIFFVIPETKEKKKGILSKLVALRKDSKELADSSKSDQDYNARAQKLQSKEDAVSQNSSSGSDLTKNNGALRAIKSTLSAIKDSVTGGAKSDKKVPCSQPERRTIIVRGQLDHESLSDSNEKLTSTKHRNEDSSVKHTSKDINEHAVDSNKLIKEENTKLDKHKESELIPDSKAISKHEFKSDTNNKNNLINESEMKSKTESKRPQNLAERLTFSKQSSPAKSDSKPSSTQINNTVSDSFHTKNNSNSSSVKLSPLNQTVSESLKEKIKDFGIPAESETNKEVIPSIEKTGNTNSLTFAPVSDTNNRKLDQQNVSITSTEPLKRNEGKLSSFPTNIDQNSVSQNEMKISLNTKASSSAEEYSTENQISSKTSLINKDKERGIFPNRKQVQEVTQKNASSTNQTQLFKPGIHQDGKQQQNILYKDAKGVDNVVESPQAKDVKTKDPKGASTSKEVVNITTDKSKHELRVLDSNSGDNNASNESAELPQKVTKGNTIITNDMTSVNKVNTVESLSSDIVDKDRLIVDNVKTDTELTKEKSEIQQESPVHMKEFLETSNKNVLQAAVLNEGLGANKNSSTRELDKCHNIQEEPVNIGVNDEQAKRINVINNSFSLISPNKNFASGRNLDYNKSETRLEKYHTFTDTDRDVCDAVMKTDENTDVSEASNSTQECDLKSLSDKSENDMRKTDLLSDNNTTLKGNNNFAAVSPISQQNIIGKENKPTNTESPEKQLELNKSNSYPLNVIPGTSLDNTQTLVQTVTSEIIDNISKQNLESIREKTTVDIPVLQTEVSEHKKETSIQTQDLSQKSNNTQTLNDKSSDLDQSPSISDAQIDLKSASINGNTKPGKLKSAKTGKVLKKSKSQSKISKELQNTENIEKSKKVESESAYTGTSESSSNVLDEDRNTDKTNAANLESEILSASKTANEQTKNNQELAQNVLSEIKTGNESDFSSTESEMKFQTSETKVKPEMIETTTKSLLTETEIKSQSIKMEMKFQPTETEIKVQPIEIKTKFQPTAAETIAQPAESEATAQPTESETIAQPPESKTISQPPEAETIAQPPEAEKIAQPAEPETKSQPIETEIKVSSTETTSKFQSIETEMKAQSTEMKAKFEPTEVETIAVSTETKTKPPPTETETKSQPTETETKPQLTETETKPQPTEPEAKPQLTETETKPQPTETETKPQPSEAETLAQLTETEPQPTETRTKPQPADTRTELQQTEVEAKFKPTKIEILEPTQNKSSDYKNNLSAEQKALNNFFVENTPISGEASSSTDAFKESGKKIGFQKNKNIIETPKIQETSNTSTSAISGSSSQNTSSSVTTADQGNKERFEQEIAKNSTISDNKFSPQIESTVRALNTSENKTDIFPQTATSANDVNAEPLRKTIKISSETSQNSEQHSKVHDTVAKIPDTLNKMISSVADKVPPPQAISQEIAESETADTYQDDSDDADIQYSDESQSSITPPNPIDTLRNRFEGLAGGMSIRGPIRPQSPFRRMSFNSRKQVIALERKKGTTEKPWFHPKVIQEPVKVTLPKRSVKQQLEMERKVRRMVADRKCRTYKKAEIVVQLMDMNFEEEEAIQAADECSTLEQAISYLQQECLLCTGYFPASQIVSMTHCQHRACRECIRAYFTVQIRDRTILDLLCPFCNEPDIGDEDIASDYFNHLDIMLKKLVDVEIHELFQRKLRDRVLMKDPNFRWCSQCSSGFIAMPNLKRLVCPDCNAVTCAFCRRVWEKEHNGISCEAFAALKDASDPEAQAAGLAKMLTEDGIDCPSCHFRYALAKGGCMHFRCIQCQHDFCSGCSRPFKMGQKCGVSEFCGKLGLHAHHPRNCLFYLRDKDPEDLQKLLDLNDIEYNQEPPEGMEVKSTCQVMEQKESAEGMMDDCCGKEVQDGYAGLCRVHYVEYLGQLVNKYKVDPIQIFDNDDLELVLRRANIRLPPKRYRESDIQYRQKLVNLIQVELPLDKMDGS